MSIELNAKALLLADQCQGIGESDGWPQLLEAAAAIRRLVAELQARAQVQGEPSWWVRETAEGAEWTDTAPLVLSGWTPLYTTPQPAPVQGELEPYDAGLLNPFGGGNVEWWQDYIRAELGRAHDFYQSQLAPPQAEVPEGIRPEDFTVDVVVKPMGGFAPVNTQGVRVTHKPTGISVTCDAARSQHANRHQAFEKLSAILALHPERVPMTDDERCEAYLKQSKSYEGYRGTFMRGVWAAEAHHGITAQAKKEGE